MANHVSSLKRVRITERRTAVNKMRKSRMRTIIKALRKAMANKDLELSQSLLPSTYSIVDRAAKWGIIKVNTASRYKARLTARLKKLQSAAA
ncbi:MAG: 30S ribosomal protein S20 [Bryobacteraceae bacterium]|jgi:small subunit ribosomal protein S20|nr:30S ribosomal protein S20 [Solibacteraceae bacterium]MCL4842442.1 30S ribosomal protein S20 [Bryobacteraceae bacterium]MCO5350853.1 30S ribosomal protein S20 [Bryobacteraceae bacterium]HAX43277.1 30S ribosomal protein S20 [Bryobacterales bacterium]HRJ19142.1 30S ribosomal protein S20 [Bryobacteraceae bacterium]